MQNGYVLSIPMDLASLERDMIAWLNLPYDLRKQGNDNCIRKYGCTNEQLYNIMKAKLVNIDMSEFDQQLSMETYLHKNKRILKGITEATFKIDPEDAVTGFTSDGQINDRLSKINRSNSITENDDDIVMINDFVDDKHPDYDIDDLEQRYQSYLAANSDHRKKADNYSIELWGRTVYDMYTYMKNKLTTLKIEKDGEQYTPSLEQQRLDNYRNTVVNESSSDVINSMIRTLDCYKNSPNRSVYESYILEQFGDTITINGRTFRQDMPGVMPFLTYYEYLHNTRHLDQRKIQAKNPFCYVLNRINNKKNIEDAYNNHDNEAMLDMGWNPYIKPTAEAFARAYERQMEFFEENYGYDIYDISKFYTSKEPGESITEATAPKKALTPIFITLLGRTNDPEKIVDRTYTYKDLANLGLSLSSDLKKVYCYELTEDYVDRITPDPNERNEKRVTTVSRIKTNDLTKIDTTAVSLHVMVFFVSPEIKKALREGIDIYMENQDKSKYAFDSIITLLNNKRVRRKQKLIVMVAMFLDSMFRVANLYDKNSDRMNVNFNFYGKSDRTTGKYSSNRRKIYIMYNGDAPGYNQKKVDKNIKWMLSHIDRTEMNFFDNHTSEQPDYYDFNTYIQQFSKYNESAKFISVMEKMKEILTPTAFIQESTLFNVSVKDMELRAKTAFALLDSYNETDLEGIKKQCKELFILYNICAVVLNKAECDPDAMLLKTIMVSIDYKLNFYIRFVKRLDPEFDIKGYSEIDPDQEVSWRNAVYKYSSNNFKYKPNIEEV